MTPNDIYRLPSRQVTPWFEEYSNLKRFFDRDSYEFDCDKAKLDAAELLRFEEKLYCPLDYGERSVSVTAVTFQGKPVGLLRSGGRGQEDAEEVIVTDKEGYLASLTYMAGWMSVPVLSDIADPDADIEDIEFFYGTVIVRVGDEVRLVKIDRLANDATVLFDDRAYSLAFDEIVRPAFADRQEEMEAGIGGARMREVAVAALRRAVPEGLEVLEFNGEGLEGCTHPHHNDYWHALLIKGPDATYSVGLSSWAKKAKWFSWGSDLSINEVGPVSLFDREAAKAAERVSDPESSAPGMR